MPSFEWLLAHRKWVYYIPESAFVPNRGYVPSIVFEGVPGHFPMSGKGECSEPWYWGMNLADAQETCRLQNESRGRLAPEVERIVASSMFAKVKVDARHS